MKDAREVLESYNCSKSPSSFVSTLPTERMITDLMEVVVQLQDRIAQLEKQAETPVDQKQLRKAAVDIWTRYSEQIKESNKEPLNE
jgi:hypothetical protein